MNVQITKTTPVYRHKKVTGNFIQWTVDNSEHSTINTTVERSGSPEGPFNTLVSNLQDFKFFDTSTNVPSTEDNELRDDINLYNLTTSFYYRVTVTNEDGTTATAVSPVTNPLPKRQKLLRNKMQRDLALSFKFNGVPLAVLKRRHWGIRCSDCYDPLTRKVTQSKCVSCYGTGFEDGYFDPVVITGRLSVDNPQVKLASQGQTEINQKRATILDYPIIDPHDIVAEINSNARYFVRHVSQTELKTVPVHQRLLLSELSRDSIEYRLSIDTSNQPRIY